MSRRDHRSVQSYLMIAMLHTIKWKTQPNKRSHSWMISIASSRKAIPDICATNPSINQAVLLSYWEQSFRKACKKATDEMRQTTDITSLSWQEVFDYLNVARHQMENTNNQKNTKLAAFY